MENTVNKRILMLKTDLGLGNSEFATKANISTTTLWNIQNEGDIAPKTIKNICEALNVSKEWLLTGNGKMYLDKAEAPVAEKSTLTKALELLEDQLRKKDDQIASLMAVISKINFLDTLDQAAGTFVFPNRKQQKPVSRAAA